MSDANATRWLQLAITEGERGARAGQGGPFGAVVVKDDRLLAAACNQVTSTNDPTAHAEVQAIRRACATLRSFQLDGCDVYASCEPCPMCLGALYWARPRAVYFAASRVDAARAGFDDEFIYQELAIPPAGRKLPLVQVAMPNAQAPFDAWLELTSRVRY